MSSTAPSTATGTRSLKERQREERERLILRAAQALILERGYHETAMDDIAARVGVSKGTLYLHFPSKEDLVLAILEREMSAFGATLDATIGAGLTPAATLRRLIEQVFGAMGEPRFQLMDAILRHPELRGRLVERRDSLRGYWAEFSRRVREVIEAGKAAGELDPTIPTAVLLGLFSSLLNPITYTQVQRSTGQSIPPEALGGYVSRFFFKGAAPEPPRQGGAGS